MLNNHNLPRYISNEPDSRVPSSALYVLASTIMWSGWCDKLCTAVHIAGDFQSPRHLKATNYKCLSLLLWLDAPTLSGRINIHAFKRVIKASLRISSITNLHYLGFSRQTRTPLQQGCTFSKYKYKCDVCIFVGYFYPCLSLFPHRIFNQTDKNVRILKYITFTDYIL